MGEVESRESFSQASLAGGALLRARDSGELPRAGLDACCL